MAEETENGGLKKLTIEGYKDPDCKDSIGKKFVVQVNPENLSLNYSVEYEPEEGLDQTEKQPKYKGNAPQDISFDFYLDDTGIIPEHNEVGKKPLLEKIEDLKHTVYYYYSEKHEPPYSKVTWGGKDLIHYKNTCFAGRLTTLKIVYTLFKPDGTPIRAKISLAFKSTVSKETAVSLAGKSSPDLTHLVTVNAGDTLPILCKKIYGDPSFYMHVAKVNNLVNFRYLEPGMELEFPPIK